MLPGSPGGAASLASRRSASSMDKPKPSTRAIQAAESRYQRNQAHAARKKQWLDSQAAAKQAVELSECTFVPSINSKSKALGAAGTGRRFRSAVRCRCACCLARGSRHPPPPPLLPAHSVCAAVLRSRRGHRHSTSPCAGRWTAGMLTVRGATLVLPLLLVTESFMLQFYTADFAPCAFARLFCLGRLNVVSLVLLDACTDLLSLALRDEACTRVL